MPNYKTAVFIDLENTTNLVAKDVSLPHTDDVEFIAKYEDCEKESDMIERGIVIVGVNNDENRALKNALLSRFSHVSIFSHLPENLNIEPKKILRVDDDPVFKLHGLAERITGKDTIPFYCDSGRIPAGMSPRQEGNESHPLFWRKKKSKLSRRGK